MYPDDFEHVIEEITLETMELPPGDKALLSLQLPAEFVIVLDPVTHTSQFIDVKGEPTRERQNLSLVFDKLRAPVQRIELRPGPLAAVARKSDRQAGIAGIMAGQ